MIFRQEYVDYFVNLLGEDKRFVKLLQVFNMRLHYFSWAKVKMTYWIFIIFYTFLCLIMVGGLWFSNLSTEANEMFKNKPIAANNFLTPVQFQWRPKTTKNYRNISNSWDKILNSESDIEPVNSFPFSIIFQNQTSCRPLQDEKEIQLIYLVKSRIENIEHRNVIRKTWGSKHITLTANSSVRTYFLMGVSDNKSLSEHLEREKHKYQDIVQGNFADTYFNNTYKLMMGLEWVTKFCGRAKILVIADDDYFINPYSLMRTMKKVPKHSMDNAMLGLVWEKARPFRERTSKWYVDVEEFPHEYFPPYPTGGATFLSMETAKKYSIAMNYVPFFRFDDVFLGIIAYELKSKLYHMKNIYFGREKLKLEKYYDVLAMHGFSQPSELFELWTDLEKNEILTNPEEISATTKTWRH